MSVRLNHTIVNVRDKHASARFLVDVLGLPEPTLFGPFVVVQIDNDVSLDFADDHGRQHPQHYAFLVSEQEFDEVYGRILERELPYWADPADTNPDAWISALTRPRGDTVTKHKASVWQALAEDKRLPPQQVRPVAAAFWRPGQDDVLQPHADRYLELIPTLHLAGAAPAAEYARCLYPTHGISQSYPERADEVAQAAAPVVGNAVRERGDLVRRMLRARAR